MRAVVLRGGKLEVRETDDPVPGPGELLIKPLSAAICASDVHYMDHPNSADRFKWDADRDTIMNAIQAENVGIGIHFRAVHLHPYYEQTFGFRRGMFPRAEYYSDRTISLPLYPRMTDAEADDVIAAVRKVIGRYRR